jgi:hypothetical protein
MAMDVKSEHSNFGFVAAFKWAEVSFKSVFQFAKGCAVVVNVYGTVILFGVFGFSFYLVITR